jgi:hypothetical protein
MRHGELKTSRPGAHGEPRAQWITRKHRSQTVAKHRSQTVTKQTSTPQLPALMGSQWGPGDGKREALYNHTPTYECMRSFSYVGEGKRSILITHAVGPRPLERLRSTQYIFQGYEYIAPFFLGRSKIPLWIGSGTIYVVARSKINLRTMPC